MLADFSYLLFKLGHSSAANTILSLQENEGKIYAIDLPGRVYISTCRIYGSKIEVVLLDVLKISLLGLGNLCSCTFMVQFVFTPLNASRDSFRNKRSLFLIFH